MKYKDTVLYKIARPIVKFLIIILYRPTIIGKENIPKEGRIVLAGNHTHLLDCILLMSSTKRSIHFLAKKELWKGPKKIIFANLGLIPVDRSKKDHTPIEKAIEYLNNDKVIGIFPEGTTEKGRGLMEFKMGAVKIANDANSSIVPFAIKGEYKIFRKKVKIIYGKPIKITNDLEKENTVLREAIKNMLEAE